MLTVAMAGLCLGCIAALAVLRTVILARRVRMANVPAIKGDSTATGDELAYAFRTDQEDRASLGFLGGIALLAGLLRRQAAWMADRDERRLRRVLALHQAGGIVAPTDQYHAAMILQHGRSPEHYRLAHELAKAAGEKGMSQAEWLARAAYDRWMISIGRPQLHGTQFPEFLFRRRIRRRCAAKVRT